MKEWKRSRVAALIAAALMIMSTATEAQTQTQAQTQKQKNYNAALGNAILFFEAQRSGKLPPNQRLTWRGDSGVKDGSSVGVDLSGGYYDAGDNVKFVFPMAFSMALLAWSIAEYSPQMQAAGELQNARTALRWGTDFLLKASATDNVLWVGVGDGNQDHACWQRPEDLDHSRPAYKIDAESPGSEAAAETAAALAAASVVFQHSDPAYSSRMASRAKSLFEFANTHRGVFNASCPFYCSYSGYEDELLWAAAWLYRATNSTEYAQYIHNAAATVAYSQEFSWDNKWAGASTLLYSMGKKGEFDPYKGPADNFVCAYVPGSPTKAIATTPGGLIWVRDSSNMGYAMAATLLIAIHSDALAARGHTATCGNRLMTPTEIFTFAKRQVDYVLGDNPKGMSYMIGYGDKYPQRPHHRASSLPSIKSDPATIPCIEGFNRGFHSASANPNPLTGALVGGPDSNDQFNDVRDNYAQQEPTTYINAPFAGLLARMSAPPPRPLPALSLADDEDEDDGNDLDTSHITLSYDDDDEDDTVTADGKKRQYDAQTKSKTEDYLATFLDYTENRLP